MENVKPALTKADVEYRHPAADRTNDAFSGFAVRRLQKYAASRPKFWPFPRYNSETAPSCNFTTPKLP